MSYPPLHWKQAWKVPAAGGDDRLHRVAVIAGPLDPADPEMYPTHLVGRTACGLVGGLVMPGIGARMAAERCALCCDAVGVPRGIGIPGNGTDARGAPIAPPDRWAGDDYRAVGPHAPAPEDRPGDQHPGT